MAALAFVPATTHASPRRLFQISVTPAIGKEPLTGRLVIVLSRKAEPEPRLSIHYRRGEQIVGQDVSGARVGTVVTLGDQAPGFPRLNLRGVPPGDYFVQAVVIRYGLMRRSDGHAIWAPSHHDRIPFTELAGNLYSDVRKVHLDPARGYTVKLALDHVIPPYEPPTDTEWLKNVRIKSEILTRFWGTPTYLYATILLPQGWAAHPNAHYPLVLAMNHGSPPYGFNPDPSDTDRNRLGEGANIESGHEFYQAWTSKDFPRLIVAAPEQSSPYFMEAYSVDSANNGPYGQAITQELIPYIERRFRATGAPYARIVQGASTGGWESLAMQVKYPDLFGGAWVFNPDPISFHHYQLVDIYKDTNAFEARVSPWLTQERPFMRDTEGQTLVTLRDLSRFEIVTGSKDRSGSQLAIWEATYGPVGPDGYPVPLWDPQTGVINRQVADYMRANGYDLTDYVRSNWGELGPKLDGKLHFISGEMDNYFLNLGVYEFQTMLAEVAPPGFKAQFDYGRPKKGHNWHRVPFAEMLREIAAHVRAHAPPSADTSQWTY